jgi:DNA-binding CsgD family transcriptional regulator
MVFERKNSAVLSDGNAALNGQTDKGSKRSGTGRIAVIESFNALSGQLSWERHARQIISSVHASLEAPVILQTVVDLLGRALSASMCLVVEGRETFSRVVTHQYVEPNMARHRSGVLPTVIGQCCEKLAAAGLASKSEQGERNFKFDPDQLEDDVRALACKPIAYDGFIHGILFVVQTDRSRVWTHNEIGLLELGAAEAAVALHHARDYARLKDRIFSMNVLSNVTQQLTNVLEQPNNNHNTHSVVTTLHNSPLSMRELEVLKLIAEGNSNREIAQSLYLTESTVELHASRLRKKLELKSRTALVKYACDNGLA